MDKQRGPLKKRASKHEQGVALILAFSVTILVLGLIASLQWASIQRHALLRKRAERSRMLYFAETGVIDAMAKLRIGVIDRNSPLLTSPYCLNPANGSTSFPCGAPSAAFPVRVVISAPNANGFNQIDITVNF